MQRQKKFEANKKNKIAWLIKTSYRRVIHYFRTNENASDVWKFGIMLHVLSCLDTLAW